ncbi:hypothetical protein BH23CHL3_BH23CHL3_01090 [soil metagenome]
MKLPGDHGLAREVEVAVATVHHVSKIVKALYDQQSSEVELKQDGSPVTDADLEADRLIRQAIHDAFPNDALLTEETADSAERLSHNRCWIADPIDGTAQFVARTGEFDVMLALVEDHLPVVSVTGHPPSGQLTLAIRGSGAWIIDAAGDVAPFRIAHPEQPPRLVTSRYYGALEFTDTIAAVAQRLGTATPPVMPVGFQPRAFDPDWRQYDGFVGFWRPDGNSPVREWDLAACDLLVTEAGGCFSNLYGNRYHFNQPSPRPKSGLLVSASPDLHQRLLDALAPMLPPSPPALNTAIAQGPVTDDSPTPTPRPCRG